MLFAVGSYVLAVVVEVGFDVFCQQGARGALGARSGAAAVWNELEDCLFRVGMRLPVFLVVTDESNIASEYQTRSCDGRYTVIVGMPLQALTVTRSFR